MCVCVFFFVVLKQLVEHGYEYSYKYSYHWLIRTTNLQVGRLVSLSGLCVEEFSGLGFRALSLPI